MAGESVLAKMAVLISANTAKFDAALASSDKKLLSFNSAISTANKILAGFGIGFGVQQIISGLSSAIGTIAGFEKQMSEVRAITGATGDDFKDLTNDALSLGKSTLYTAKQVGELQVAYGRLGFTKDEIIAATKATLDLATATGEDLAKSADVAGSTIRAFGKSANETQNVTDIMAASFNQTALGLENFSEAMKYVAPIAASANISLEQTTALLGVLADNGIRGSSAGTSLRKIISDLKSETGTFTEKLQKLAAKGISSADAMDEVGRTAYASLLILTKNTPRVDELTASFKNVTGATAEMARVMSDNLSGDATKLSTAFDGLLLSFTNISGPLRAVTQELRFIIGALSGDTNIEIDKELDRVAQSIKGVATEAKAQTSIDEFISKLSDLRRESGKPIELGVVKTLTDKYKLTEDQANQLYTAVVKVNKALSGDEIIVKNFDQFAKGYKTTKEAADAFNKTQYELITAAQIQQSENKKAFKAGEEVGDEIQKQLKTEITGRFRAIGVVNDYVKSLEKTIPVIQKINDVEEETEKEREARLKKVLKIRLQFDKETFLKPFADAKRAFYAARKQHEEDFKIILKVDDEQLTKLPYRIKDIGPALKKAVAEAKQGLNSLGEFAQESEKKITYITGVVTNGIAGLADAIGTALGSGDFKNFGKGILEAVAGFAQQLGALMITSGIAEIVLETGNPAAMVVAGAALVAAGAAIKSTLDKKKTIVSSAGNATGRSSGSTTRFDGGGSGQQITFNGEFRVQGNDLVAVLNNTNAKNGRING